MPRTSRYRESSMTALARPLAVVGTLALLVTFCWVQGVAGQKRHVVFALVDGAWARSLHALFH